MLVFKLINKLLTLSFSESNLFYFCRKKLFENYRRMLTARWWKVQPTIGTSSLSKWESGQTSSSQSQSSLHSSLTSNTTQTSLRISSWTRISRLVLHNHNLTLYAHDPNPPIICVLFCGCPYCNLGKYEFDFKTAESKLENLTHLSTKSRHKTCSCSKKQLNQ